MKERETAAQVEKMRVEFERQIQEMKR